MGYSGYMCDDNTFLSSMYSSTGCGNTYAQFYGTNAALASGDSIFSSGNNLNYSLIQAEKSAETLSTKNANGTLSDGEYQSLINAYSNKVKVYVDQFINHLPNGDCNLAIDAYKSGVEQIMNDSKNSYNFTWEQAASIFEQIVANSTQADEDGAQPDFETFINDCIGTARDKGIACGGNMDSVVGDMSSVEFMAELALLNPDITDEEKAQIQEDKANAKREFEAGVGEGKSQKLERDKKEEIKRNNTALLAGGGGVVAGGIVGTLLGGLVRKMSGLGGQGGKAGVICCLIGTAIGVVAGGWLGSTGVEQLINQDLIAKQESRKEKEDAYAEINKEYQEALEDEFAQAA